MFRMDSDSDNDIIPFASQGEWSENREGPKISAKNDLDKLSLIKVDIR